MKSRWFYGVCMARFWQCVLVEMDDQAANSPKSWAHFQIADTALLKLLSLPLVPRKGWKEVGHVWSSTGWIYLSTCAKTSKLRRRPQGWQTYTTLSPVGNILDFSSKNASIVIFGPMAWMQSHPSNPQRFVRNKLCK